MKLPTGNLKKEWGGTFNLLYILGSGSKWQNNEIRYSIRSAEKYVGNLGRVFIVGEFPKFLSRKNKKITYIEVHDFTSHKLRNAIRKLRIAVMNPDVPENFILMNDDFFFMKPMRVLPLWHRGFMKDTVAQHETKGGYYFMALQDTYNMLSFTCKIKNPLDYEVHTPMHFEKSKLYETLALAEKLNDEVLIRSLYANMYNLGGEYRDDVKLKVYEDIDDYFEKDLLSTDDKIVQTEKLQRLMVQKFSKMSHFETP